MKDVFVLLTNGRKLELTYKRLEEADNSYYFFTEDNVMMCIIPINSVNFIIKKDCFNN